MIRELLLFLYRRRRLLLGITGLVTLFILVTTLLPSNQLNESKFLKFDKIIHALVFGGWTYLFGLVRYSYTGRPTSYWSLDLLAGIGFGLGIELLQYFLPTNRSAEFYDFLADLLGVLLAIYFLKQTQRQLIKELDAS